LLQDPGLGAVLRTGEVACTETSASLGELLALYQ